MPQTGKNIFVDFKVEATLNTAPSTGSAERLRLTAAPGLSLRKQAIRSNEIRADYMSTVPRHGSRHVEGSYSGELSVNSFETILAAVARATIVAAVTITEATSSLASITFGTNTVVATNTSTGTGFISAGLRVGDVFRVSGTSGANDDLNAMVMAVATHTVTVHDGAFTSDASAATTFSLTIGKKISNGTTPVRNSYYIDQYQQDNDLSEVFGGCRFTGFRIDGSPNGMATVNISAMGMSVTALASGASPYYVSPTEYTTDPLVFADAIINLRGTKITTATAFSLDYQVTAQTLPVIGTSVTPDVFDNEARLSGTLTVMREDLANLTSYADEDEIELAIMLQEAGTDPKGFLSIFVPRLKFMNLDAPLGSDGAMTETIQWEAGYKASATGYDQTMLTITQNA